MISVLFKEAISKKVFKGNYYLKIEKHPYYASGNDMLVKAYEIGPTNISLRCKNISVDVDKIMILAKLPNFPDLVELSKMYVSSIQNIWRLHKNSMTPIGHGLAELVNSTSLDAPYRKVLGYYGYTHRGGSTFKIGDRLFDEKYTPKEEDYPEWQWAGWRIKFKDARDKADDFYKESIYSDGIACIVPFKLRGSKVIETLEEARQAAINMSSYLS